MGAVGRSDQKLLLDALLMVEVRLHVEATGEECGIDGDMLARCKLLELKMKSVLRT